MYAKRCVARGRRERAAEQQRRHQRLARHPRGAGVDHDVGRAQRPAELGEHRREAEGDQRDTDRHRRGERRAGRAGKRRGDDQAAAHAAAHEVRGGTRIPVPLLPGIRSVGDIGTTHRAFLTAICMEGVIRDLPVPVAAGRGKGNVRRALRAVPQIVEARSGAELLVHPEVAILRAAAVDTLLCGSSRSPNASACEMHAFTQAGVASGSTPGVWPVASPASMRSTQNVHFVATASVASSCRFVS